MNDDCPNTSPHHWEDCADCRDIGRRKTAERENEQRMATVKVRTLSEWEVAAKNAKLAFIAGELSAYAVHTTDCDGGDARTYCSCGLEEVQTRMARVLA